MKKNFTPLLLTFLFSLMLYIKADAQNGDCCTHNVITQTACDSFSWHGTTYTQSGNFIYQYTNSAGCPSTDTLYLTMHYGMHYPFHITACGSYTWNGTTYTQSGTYLYNYICGNNCPSVDTLYLVINQPMHYPFHITACSSYTWNGTTYTQSGTYLYNYICGNGCPSVDTLYLTINQPMHYAFHITACSQYTWNGTTYTQSGTYLYNYVCGNNCPSVDTLYLTISQPMHYAFHITACGSYTWNGTTYTQCGTYLYNYVCGNNCPSVDTLYLIINYGTHNSLCQTSCGCYTWNGKSYSQSGTYIYNYTNASGCASADTLHLTVSNNTLVMGACSETNPTCGGCGSSTTGSVSAGNIISSNGAVTYVWKNVAGVVVGTTATVNGLGAGTYTLTASDKCSSVTCCQTITAPVTLVMGACSETNPSCGYSCGSKNTGSVSAGCIISSNGPVSYVWRNASGCIVGTCATVGGLAPGTYTLTASDKCGSVTCCATIVAPVTPTCSIDVTPCNNTYTGGVPTTIYLGYGPQSITLNSHAEGGSGFTYSWTGNGLSCHNCADPVFTATCAGSFEFDVLITNCSGCTTSCSITICVIDPRCGSSFNFCHYGNNCKLSAGACAAYLNSCHGDHLGFDNQVCGGDGGWGNGGSCGGNGSWGNGGNCGGNNGGWGNGGNGGSCGSDGHDYKTDAQTAAANATENALDVKVYPNPFTSQFHLSVISPADEDVHVKIFDITGQAVYEKNVTPVSDNIIVGDNLPSGVYFIQVIQGGQLQLIRMVKQQ